MKTETDLALLILSVLLFGTISGTYAALQVLSFIRNGDENGSKRTFRDTLFDEPVLNYLTLGLGRILSTAFALVMSYRFAVLHLSAEAPLSAAVFVFIALVLLVPLFLAKLLALRAPEGFVELSRFVILPLVYILKPIMYPVVAVLRRLSPGLLDGLSFPILPLKRRIELFGYKDGEEETEEQHLMSSVFDFGDT